MGNLCHCACSEWMHFSRSLSSLLILTLHYRVCEISRTCLIYKLICQQQQIVRQLLLFQLQQIDWKHKQNWEEFQVRQFTRTLSPSLSLSLFFSPAVTLFVALCTTSVTAGRRTLTWTRTWAAFSIRFDLWSLSARARALCLFSTRSSFLPQLFALPFSYALLVFWPRLCSCWVCVCVGVVWVLVRPCLS